MPRCERTPSIVALKDVALPAGKAPPAHVLLANEKPIRILVSAPESGTRYGNFFFNQKNEPIDVTPRELEGLKTDHRLAIVVPGDMANEQVEKDSRIAALLQENTVLRGRIVELEGQVKDREALLTKAQRDLEDATAPVAPRAPVSTTEPTAEDKNTGRPSRRAA